MSSTEGDDVDFETVLLQMIAAAEPMPLIEGSLLASRYLLQKFAMFQDAMFAANQQNEANGGEGGIDPGILFGGLVLTLINVVMDEDGWPAAKRIASALDIPTHAREGVRSRVVSLLDALGLHDDSHRFN